MRACILALLLLFAAPASAEIAKVSGGEHADFTRLVVEAKGIGDWRLGRSVDGYELAPGPEISGYDVTNAFRKIPRDRITALWRDPDSGRLRFSLACACHAVAFEFRPGIVVIDLRSGPPPDGSAFEVPLDALPKAGAAPAMDAPAASALVAGYDWIAIARTTAVPDPGLPLPTAGISLDPLRDALLAQISRGVAEGVVDITGELPAPAASAGTVGDGPWARVGIGELPGLKAGADLDVTGTLTADGQSCIPDAALDLAGWGHDGPVSVQIGLGRTGLLTEFDAPVPTAILRAARLHIALGFGAEARQYLGLLGDRRDEEISFLTALSHIVDEEPVAGSPFDGQHSCDSAAALWATLARRGQPIAPRTNAAAVARSFSALPPHLRRYLGAPLVDAFLAAGDQTTARLIRDAVTRLPPGAMPGIQLMEARFQLAEGEEQAAGRIAAGVLAEGSTAGAEAVVTLVEAAFRGTRQIDPRIPSALDAYLLDARGTALQPALLRARVLAAAMTGAHAKAFALLDESPGTLAELWSLSAEQTADDLFLEQAARWAASPTGVARPVRRQIANRLAALGFPDLALQWLGPVDGSSEEELRLLAARARLDLRDAPAALLLLAGINASEAARMRAEASLQLGDAEAAARLLLQAGATVDGQRTLAWTQDWPLIGAEGPQAWRAAAGRATPDPAAPAAGPIARGAALADESAGARAVIEGLLLAVPAPRAPKQLTESQPSQP